MLRTMLLSMVAPVLLAGPGEVSQVRTEFCVVTGMESGRGRSCDSITVELNDGNQYTIETPIEDTFIGDVFFCERDTNGTETPLDDEVYLTDYVGWEVYDECDGMYEWHLWLNGNEIVAYSLW